MKKNIRILCFVMMLIMLLSACGEQDVPQQGEQESTKEEETTKELAPPMVLVGADGKANCTVTVPKDSSEAVTEIVNDFIKDVQKKTGVKLPVVDEYSAISTRYEIAINSIAGRPPVEEQLKQTAYTDYSIGIWDWHIMLTSRSDAATKAGLKKIYKSLEKIDDGYCIREDMSVSGSSMLGDKKASVPVYDTLNGTELTFYSVKDGYEVYIENTTKAETMKYAEKLSQYGYSRYSENAIGENLSYVYTAEDMHVFLNYDHSLKAARVVFEKAGPLPSLEKPTLTPADNAEMSVAQIGIAGLGMSYVIQLKDYSFIVIDGGTKDETNTTKLYNYMIEKTPAGKKPVIACWVFTHADPDHIGAPQTFLNKYMENVELESVVCNFPDCSVQDSVQNDEQIGSAIFALENLINNFYDATVYNAHTGQKFYFKGVEMEILFTEEDTYPLKVNSYNDTCVMAKLTFDSGKTFMVLGDSTEQTSKQLAATYKNYLKSDILQLAHHGLIGGDKTLYSYIDPEICFWATSKERFEGKHDTNKDGTVNSRDVQHCLGQGGCDYNSYIRNDSIRKRIHYHGGETFVVSVG